MRLLKVELENVRCHKSWQSDFHPGAVFLRGSNGSGKSSVLYAISWALFDNLPIKTSEFIRKGATYACASVTFESQGKTYRVVRDTRKGVSVEQPLMQFQAEGLRNVQVYLQQVFGSRTSLAVLYRDALSASQGGLLRGLDGAKTSRTEHWSRVLQLTKYRESYVYLRPVQSQLKTELAEIKAAIVAYKEAIGLVELPDARSLSEVKAVRTSCKAEVVKLGHQLELYRAAQTRHHVLEEKHKALVLAKAALGEALDQLLATDRWLKEESEHCRVLSDSRRELIYDADVVVRHRETADTLVRLQATSIHTSASLKQAIVERVVCREEIREGKEAEEKLFSALEEQTMLQVKRDAAEIASALARGQSLEAQQQVDLLRVGGTLCPVCSSVMTEAKTQELFAAAEERFRTKTQEAEQYTLFITDTAKSLASCSRLVLFLRESSHGASDTQQKKYRGLNGQVSQMQAALLSQHQEIASMEEEVVRLAQQAEEAAQVNREKTRLDAELQALQGSIDLQAASYKAIQRQAESLSSVVDQDVEDYDPAMLQEADKQVVRLQQEELEARTQLGLVEDHLTKLEQVTRLESKVQNKSGELQKAIEVLDGFAGARSAIRDIAPLVAEAACAQVVAQANLYWQMFGRPGVLTWDGTYLVHLDGKHFGQLSGGEKVASALAIKLAVAEIYAQAFSWLVLDEPTVFLDEQSRQGLANILSRIPVDQVLICSHDDTFGPATSQVIQMDVELGL